MPSWWPYPFCPSGLNTLQRQYTISERRQRIQRKREERERRREAMLLRRFQPEPCVIVNQVCEPEPCCSPKPSCSKPKRPVKDCCCSMGEPSCPPVPRCAPPPTPCHPLRNCITGDPLCPTAMGTPTCKAVASMPECVTIKKRKKKRPLSLSELACQSLFHEECECSQSRAARRKRRRGRQRPRTRNLCCRCIICWVVVGSIAYFAAYWIPIFAAVIPPP